LKTQTLHNKTFPHPCCCLAAGAKIWFRSDKESVLPCDEEPTPRRYNGLEQQAFVQIDSVARPPIWGFYLSALMVWLPLERPPLALPSFQMTRTSTSKMDADAHDIPDPTRETKTETPGLTKQNLAAPLVPSFLPSLRTEATR
jgi:hypothetical protein